MGFLISHKSDGGGGGENINGTPSSAARGGEKKDLAWKQNRAPLLLPAREYNCQRRGNEARVKRGLPFFRNNQTNGVSAGCLPTFGGSFLQRELRSGSVPGGSWKEKVAFTRGTRMIPH